LSELFARISATLNAADADGESKNADGIPIAERGHLPSQEPKASQTPPGYRVLARKYRPTTFAQLIGQNAMMRTLTNAITTGRLPQAWMLTGVRGIGKTTTARIIARALNCTGPDGKGGPTIEPCGHCDACRMIAEDRHVDVLEMDAASHTSVDDIRDIIEGVRYGPVSARYKIYILDEVHMLSKNAFNALLKTLEEPPPHTKFIFATTEIRKVPVTVLSRCQRFDLRRIDSLTLAKHFTEVAALEKVSVEPEAIKLLANAADGSVRDGLSLLDQAIARGNGKVIAVDVKDMLGLADRVHSLSLCRELMRGEMKAALATLATMQQAGSDPLQILHDMCDLVHLLTRAQIVSDFAQDPSLPEYDRQLLSELSDVKVPALARAWQILLKGVNEVQNATHPGQAAEMVFIRLAYAAELPPPADLIRQLRETINANPATDKANVPVGNSPPAGRARMGSTVGNVGTSVAHAVARQSVPQDIPQALVQSDVVALKVPTNFKELVALFNENREGALHAQLYSNVHPVRCELGLLEIRVGPNAPTNLAARLSQCLSQWTAQRWMVSISDNPGAPTLAEQDRVREQKRQQKANEHPLMQAVLTSFPKAKLLSLKQRTVAPLIVPSDDAASAQADTALQTNDFEEET